MNVFAVFGFDQSSALGDTVLTVYPDHHHVLPDGSILIATDEATSKGVAEKLMAEREERGEVFVVTPVVSYWGVQQTTVWEWMQHYGR